MYDNLELVGTHVPTLEENAKTLTDFGPTNKQAMVYLTAVRLGVATMSQISKNSNFARSEIYRVLTSLKKMGLVERVLGNPIKVRATPVEEASAAMIKQFSEETNRKVASLEAITVEFHAPDCCIA